MKVRVLCDPNSSSSENHLLLTCKCGGSGASAEAVAADLSARNAHWMSTSSSRRPTCGASRDTTLATATPASTRESHHMRTSLMSQLMLESDVRTSAEADSGISICPVR